MCNDTRKNEKTSSIRDWAVLVVQLFRSGAKWYAKKLVVLFDRDNFDMSSIPDKSKIMTVCSKQMRDSYSHILQIQ